MFLKKISCLPKEADVKLKREMKRLISFFVIASMLVSLTGCDDDSPQPNPAPTSMLCYLQENPRVEIKDESIPYAGDGEITNKSKDTIEVTSVSDPTRKFTLAPEQTQTNLRAGDYAVRWAPKLDCTIDNNRNITIIIKKGVIDIESVVHYTEGSYQEWALWALAQVPNSAEQIRFYNYMVKVYTYLQIHDNIDYIDEYNAGKADLEREIQNTKDEALRERQKLAILDDAFSISIKFPITEPFNLNIDDYYFKDLHDNKTYGVSEHLRAANPQFFLALHGFNLRNSDDGQYIAISLSAYYAFAENRRKTQQIIENGYNAFEVEFKKAKVNPNNRCDVAKYVHDDVIKTLTYNHQSYPNNYTPRALHEGNYTILGYFGDSKLTWCGGYAMITAYLLNRLGVPTIEQRDNPPLGIIGHAWNITQMENEQWYFLDTTWDMYGGYRNFLKGRGTGGTKPDEFLYNHVIMDDIIYPECSIEDYPLGFDRID